MIVEILAIWGGLHILDNLTREESCPTLPKEDWIDKAGIQWEPTQLLNFTKEKRIYLFGYDPINL